MIISSGYVFNYVGTHGPCVDLRRGCLYGRIFMRPPRITAISPWTFRKTSLQIGCVGHTA